MRRTIDSTSQCEEAEATKVSHTPLGRPQKGTALLTGATLSSCAMRVTPRVRWFQPLFQLSQEK